MPEPAFTLPGIRVHDALEWMFTFGWNLRSRCPGIRKHEADTGSETVRQQHRVLLRQHREVWHVPRIDLDAGPSPGRKIAMSSPRPWQREIVLESTDQGHVQEIQLVPATQPRPQTSIPTNRNGKSSFGLGVAEERFRRRICFPTERRFLHSRSTGMARWECLRGGGWA